MEGGGRPEGARGDDDGEEIRQIWGGEVVDGIECVEKDFECNSEFDREPVKLLENGGDMVKGGGSGDDAGCRVLDQLKLMKGCVRGTEKE